MEEKIETTQASTSPEDFMTKMEFEKMAKEHLAEREAAFTQALQKFAVAQSPDTAAKLQVAKEKKSLAQWMVAYGQSDIAKMKKATQDFVADTGTPTYAGNLVHPVFEEMVYRFTARWTPIYNASRKIRLARGQGNTFNTQELVADVVASWGAEGAMKNVTRATFARPNVTLDKLQGIVIMTDELRADAFMDFPTFIAERMSRQMGIALERGLLIGNGANTDGIFNTVGVTFLNIGTALTDFTYDDLLRGKIEYLKVADAFNPSAAAYISPDTYGNILLQKDLEGAYVLQNTNPSGVSPEGVTPAFLGQVPYVVSTQIPTAGLSGGDPVGVYGDLGEHSLVIEKEGMEVLYSQHGSVTFENDDEEDVTVNAYQQDLTLGRFVRRVAGLVVNPSGLVVYRLGAEQSS